MDLCDIKKKVVEVSNRYAKNCSINRDKDWYVLKLQEEVGELIQDYLSFSGRGRKREKTDEQLKQDFADELADVFGQILLIANYHNIDIETALEKKWFKYLKE